MLNRYKKLVELYIVCEYWTHYMVVCHEAAPKIIEKVEDYTNRLGVPSTVTVHEMNSMDIIFMIDDGIQPFYVKVRP